MPLGGQHGLAVAGDAVGEPRDGLHAKDGLGLRREGDGGLEGVGYAVRLEEGDQVGGVGRVAIDDGARGGDVDSEAVRGVFFLFLSAS